MRLIRQAGALGVLFVVLAASMSLAAEEFETNRYTETVDRIGQLGRIHELSPAMRLERMAALRDIANEVEREWRDVHAESYCYLTRRICGVLSSFDFGTLESLYLSQTFAMRALEKADEIPLYLETQLLGPVQQAVDAEGKHLSGEPFANLRQKQVRLWLHAWQRIEKTIDDNWDPEDRPSLNLCPPHATGSPSGVPPSAVKDPALRAEYEAAIEANRRKAERYIIQSGARELKKGWIPGAQRFIIGVYMEEPARDAELEGLLRQYVADPNMRAKVITAVENKQMPEDLILRNTTQPSN